MKPDLYLQPQQKLVKLKLSLLPSPHPFQNIRFKEWVSLLGQLDCLISNLLPIISKCLVLINSVKTEGWGRKAGAKGGGRRKKPQNYREQH